MFERIATNARDERTRITIKKMISGDVFINLEKIDPDIEIPHKAQGQLLKAEDINAAVAELLKEV